MVGVHTIKEPPVADAAVESAAGEGSDGFVTDVSALDDGFVDDGSWAAPRARASGRWKLFAAFLAVVTVMVAAFGFGVRYQKGRATGSTGSATTGTRGTNGSLAGGLGGFSGNFGGRPGSGSLATSGRSGTGVTNAAGQSGQAPTEEQMAQIFAQRNGGSASSASEFRGTVQSVDGDQVTLRTEDGSTVTVTLGTDTPIGQRATATAKDLVSGTAISVTAETGSDGSLGAKSVTIGDLAPTTTVAASSPVPGAAPGAATTDTTVPADLGGLLPGG